MKFNIKNISLVLLAAMAGCTPDSKNESLGPLAKASFTAAPTSTNTNKIAVASTTKGAFRWRWTASNGQTSTLEQDTMLFVFKGDYSIQLKTFSSGGADSVSQNINVPQDAPVTDILQGGDFSDASKWTVLNTSGTQTTIDLSGGAAVFSNGTASTNTNGAIYQAINVKANTYYILHANVQGSGANNTWLEFYVGTTVPSQGSDYSDNKFTSMNTWTGCGKVPFNGDIAQIGCDGTGAGKAGLMKFSKAGTVYLVIKGGSSGGSMGDGGITVDNVQFEEVQ
jgi:hypothetical protein